MRKIQLEAVLIEYQVLRTEMLQKFKHQLQIYSIILSLQAITIGWIITNKTYDLLLTIPIISTALSLRYLWEQTVATMLADFIYDMEENIFPNLLNEERSNKVKWIRWETYYKENVPKLPLYKPARLVILVFIPVVPAIVYSTLAILNYSNIIRFDLFGNTVPIFLHICCLIVYIPIFIILTRSIWKL